MAGRECYHCKQWIEDDEPHDCWTTTESALTQDLSEDLRDAWERLRETAAGFGEQRIYASHNSIMFARKVCYFFVRPKRNFLEVVVFLARAVRGPHVRKAARSSKTKVYHVIHVTHRDQVEPPISDWLREAYDLQDAVAARPRPNARARRTKRPARAKPKPTRSKSKSKPRSKPRRSRARRR